MDLNCKIYEYDGFIHSKMEIIDDQYIYSGSANIDFRSFLINFESALLIDSHVAAKHANDIFDEYLNNSKLIDETFIKKYFSLKNK
jgi:cardiolipin synthase